MQLSTDTDEKPLDDQEFANLLRRVKAGNSDAAWELIDRYGPHVQRVVRRLLHRRLRQQFDSVDFVQSVWAAFFQNPAEILSFESPDGVIGYLAHMARNKVIDENRRRLGTQKHNVQRVVSLEDCRIDDGDLVDHQPRPSQVAVARERWNRLVEQQSDRCREAVRLRLKGMSYADIGRHFGIDESAVRKMIGRLLQLQHQDSPAESEDV